ncbi:MAG: TraI domain-containing protein [Legionellaceae bacterium]|nr:TraI domain-containing protein [Legionellaceae bacterium]
MFSKGRNKVKSSVAVKALKDLIATEEPNVAIQNKGYQKLIDQIKDGLGFKESEFELLAMPLILKTVKYCQKLPESSMYYAHLGGLFDLALNRAEAAIHLMRQFLVMEEKDKPSEEQKLWLYALFSAAMLQGLGKLYTDYTVEVYDKNGQHVKCWQPLLESLAGVGEYYYYELLKGDDVDLRNSITPLMARRIMPKPGFEKIMSNKEVFSDWLALLREDKDSARQLVAILDRANAIAIQRYLHSFLLKHGSAHGMGNRLGTFVDTKNDHNLEREMVMGAEFIAWLTASIESGKIILNQSPLMVQVTEASVILHPSVLDIYMQEHHKLKNRVAIQKSFLAWKLHLLTDAAVDAFGQTEKQALSGIHLDTAILPEKVKIYNPKTDKISSMSSLNLVLNLQSYGHNQTMSKLSTAGKWISGEDNVADLRNQATQRV